MNIENEAVDWINNTTEHKSLKSAFISGANSKYVEYNKIQSLINENQSFLEAVKLHGNERLRFVITERINILTKQLNDLTIYQ